jgi:hypothetical protein
MIGTSFDRNFVAADADDSSHDANLGLSFSEYQALFDVQLDVRCHGILAADGFAQLFRSAAHTIDRGSKRALGRQAARQI